VIAAVADIEIITKEARLISTSLAAERTRIFFEQWKVLPEDPDVVALIGHTGRSNIYNHLRDIISRIRDDCKSRLYLQIAPDDESLLDLSIDHFGAQVRQSFGDAVEDIAEAAACLALERPTACVFHLMRALEVATAVVANKLGATISDQHGRGLPWA
jgi:hypothetical protein